MGTSIFCVPAFKRPWIERTVCDDVFSVKLDHTTVLRALTLKCEISEISEVAVSHKNDALTSMIREIIGIPPRIALPNVAARQKVLELLYKIATESGFNLSIEVDKEYIRLNLWPDNFSTFDPVLEDFEREGAHVRIRFSYIGKRGKHPVEIDLTELVRHHDPKCGNVVS
jgi:hypothetical protein